MPQLTLPVFPEESTPINLMLAVEKRDGTVYYFHGLLPVFHHAEDDIQSFRMFISQLIVQGSCKQVEIIRAFGVPPISVLKFPSFYYCSNCASIKQPCAIVFLQKIFVAFALEQGKPNENVGLVQLLI